MGEEDSDLLVRSEEQDTADVSFFSGKKSPKLKRSFGISSSYFHISSRGLADLSGYLIDTLDASLDWVDSHVTGIGNLPARLFFWLTGAYVYEAYNISFHEFGHGLSYRANGGTFDTRVGTKTDDGDNDTKKRENFFAYFFRSIFKGGPFRGGNTHYRGDSEIDETYKKRQKAHGKTWFEFAKSLEGQSEQAQKDLFAKFIKDHKLEKALELLGQDKFSKIFGSETVVANEAVIAEAVDEAFEDLTSIPGGKSAVLKALDYTDKEISLVKSFDIIHAAAGMNNETYAAERIADRIFENKKGSAFEWWAYLAGKLSPLCYCSMKDYKKGPTSDDPVSLWQDYKNWGIIDDVSKSDFVLAYTLSLLCSGTTYAPMFAARRKGFSVFGGKQGFSPLEFHGFRIPETFVYMTSKGIAYRVKSGYRFNDSTTITFGTEFVAKGESKMEAVLGGHKTFGSLKDLGISATFTFGKEFNVDFSCNVPLSHQFFFDIGYSTYSADSLYGERLTSVNKFNERRGHEVWVSLSRRFNTFSRGGAVLGKI